MGETRRVGDWSNHELVDIVDDVMATTIELAYDLGEDAASLPTDCPGWTVRDQLAHMVGLEQILGGAPAPTVELPPLHHVTSDVHAYMERPVHVRRGLPLVAVADELAGLRPRRIEQMRRQADEGDPEVAAPMGGRRPLSLSTTIRVFDLWVHEQDIRRAVGLPVRTGCAAAGVGLDRALAGWSGALSERSGAIGSLTIRLVDRGLPDIRIELGEPGDDAASVLLAGDVGDLLRVFCGRNAPIDDLLTGDATLARSLAPHLAMTP